MAFEMHLWRAALPQGRRLQRRKRCGGMWKSTEEGTDVEDAGDHCGHEDDVAGFVVEAEDVFGKL